MLEKISFISITYGVPFYASVRSEDLCYMSAKNEDDLSIVPLGLGQINHVMVLIFPH